MKKSLWIIALALLLASFSFAQELNIAAAADLTSVLPKITAEFTKQTGIQVKNTLGSSGNLTTQIENGAPFDILLSADIEYPTRLIDHKLAEKDTLYEYASGRLVVWVPASSKLDVSKGLQSLTNPAIKKIAIANPAHAPYGRAAVAALKSANLYDQLQSKFVMGENISQTAQFAQSGAADVGLLALSLALNPATANTGRYAVVPAELHPPLRQAGVIITASKHKAEAAKFMAFLKSPAIVQMMKGYGFTIPGK